MYNAAGSFFLGEISELALARRAKEEAEKNLEEALSAKTGVEQEFGQYRAASDEKVRRMGKRMAELTTERDAAMQELHRARLGQGAAFTAFFERVVCSSLFPGVATDLAGSLSLSAVDAALDDVIKDFPALEKGKYVDPPLGDDEVLQAIASVSSGWIRKSPVLKAVLTSPSLLSEDQIRELCPEDREEDLVRLLAEANNRPLEELEDKSPEDGSGPEENRDGEDGGPNVELNSDQPPPHSEVRQTADVPPQTEAQGHPSSGDAEQNVD